MLIGCPWCRKAPTIFERGGRWMLIHQCNGMTVDSESRSRAELEARWNGERLSAEALRDIIMGVIASQEFQPSRHDHAADSLVAAIATQNDEARKRGEMLRRTA